MPPKKKAQEAKVKKIVEDKTFGLKNKNKSAKVQKYVQQVQQQAQNAGKTSKEARMAEIAKQNKEKSKKLKEEAAKEMQALFQQVMAKPQVVPAGVDPKSVVCEFFKAGKCTKGYKCKFSHSLDANRKVAKIDLYTDLRDLKDDSKEKENDTMDKWDMDKLSSVVTQKAASEKRKMPPTDIVCKYFLDAVETNKYGWLWRCPNGEDCHYQHKLPPGFVLKKEKEVIEAEKEEIPLEEILENERAKLDLNRCTPLTLEVFKKWKADRAAKKMDEVKQKAEEAKKAPSGKGIMSGREMFMFDPTLFQDSADADEEQYIISDHEDEDDEKHQNNHQYDGNPNDPSDDENQQNGHQQENGNGRSDEDEEAQQNKPPDNQIVNGPINSSLFEDEDDVPPDS